MRQRSLTNNEAAELKIGLIIRGVKYSNSGKKPLIALTLLSTSSYSKMGFLTHVPALPELRAPQSADETFYGTTLAGSDVCSYEMAEEEVCTPPISFVIRPINTSDITLDASSKRLPVY